MATQVTAENGKNVDKWVDSLPVMKMTQQQFRALNEYSSTIPTGTTPGKMWKRLHRAYDTFFIHAGGKPQWVIGQYDPDCPKDSKTIDIHWYRPIITLKAATK